MGTQSTWGNKFEIRKCSRQELHSLSSQPSLRQLSITVVLITLVALMVEVTRLMVVTPVTMVTVVIMATPSITAVITPAITEAMARATEAITVVMVDSMPALANTE